MKLRWVAALFTLAFLATLVLHAPAALLHDWGRNLLEPSGLSVQGVHGTLAEGGFSGLAVNHRPTLRDGRWTLRPAWLALLRVTADVEAGDDARVRARVSRSVFGALRVSGLNATGSVKSLLQLAGQPPLPLEGRARLELPLVRIAGGLPVEAEGSLEVENLAWTLAREPLMLGSFNAAVTTEPRGIQVSFGSGPGPLEVGGTATLGATREYELDLQLRPRPDAAAQLVTLVQSLGPADAQGWHQLRRKGVLP